MRLRVAVVAVAAGLLLPGVASAVTCPQRTIKQRLDDADVAFVGRLVSSTPVTTGTGVAQFDFRFVVDQGVKGNPGRYATVRAAQLVDLDGKPLTAEPGLAVGVLATAPAGRLVTSSCGLVDAGSLLGAADEPRGGAIKVAIGIVLLAIVLAYSLRRLKRRTADQRADDG